MNTIRECDYWQGDEEILKRIERVEQVQRRRREVNAFVNQKLQVEEQCQIEIIDGLLRWLREGGELPTWIEVEESRQDGERIVEL